MEEKKVFVTQNHKPNKIAQITQHRLSVWIESKLLKNN